MDAYITMTTLSDRIEVTYNAELATGPHVILHIGEAGIHISPDLARKLAEDILAALPAATA